ncbi:kinase-like protein [Phellopilus nigrolimitatus]|nr:kinase-like protein [Phellopilus nigrolimitatus]
MILELEDTFGASLPAKRSSHWQNLQTDLVIYPITTYYYVQYLHWLSEISERTDYETITVDLFLNKAHNLLTGSPLMTIARQAMAREFLTDILQRSEETTYHDNPDSEKNWPNLFRHSLKFDERDMALLLTSRIHNRTSDVILQEALEMDKTDILSLMDVLQLASNNQFESCRVLERFLQKLVNVTGFLPKFLFLSNIKRVGKNPITGGGFADVWKGSMGGNLVALKVLRNFGLSDSKHDHHQDFCKEAMIWRQFCHPNILPFYGVCTEEFSPRLALVSPWMDNGDVLSYLKHNPDTDRIALIVGISVGLCYLHTLKPLVVHGDLRAANVLIDPNGHPKLADFGLAKLVDSQASTVAASSFTGKGAMRWQAPELLDSSRFSGIPCEITTCSDVYAFASVCLEVFTEDIPFSQLRDGQVVLEVVKYDRRPPWPGAQAAQRGLSDDMWVLMEKCWATYPAERPDIQSVVQNLTESGIVDAYSVRASCSTNLYESD